MTIDNVPQAKWLATAPPDEVIIARLTKLGSWEELDEGWIEACDRHQVHLYFDTATDMLYKCVETSYGPEVYWFCTDPNRKGVFA
jgi:hypothetical protein